MSSYTLKQTDVKKSAHQKGLCTYESQYGYQIVLTKNKDRQVVVQIFAKEITFFVNKKTKNPITFLIDSTHRENKYRTCFFIAGESITFKNFILYHN